MINHRGKVVGVAFYDPDSTHCLPINIAASGGNTTKNIGMQPA